MFYFFIFLTFYLLGYTFHPTMTYSSVWLRPVKWKINSSKFSILSAVTIRWFKIESVERNTLFFPLAPYFLNLRSPQLCSLFILSYLFIPPWLYVIPASTFTLIWVFQNQNLCFTVFVKTTLQFAIQNTDKNLSLTMVSPVHKIQVDRLNNIRRKKTRKLCLKLEHEKR